MQPRKRGNPPESRPRTWHRFHYYKLNFTALPAVRLWGNSSPSALGAEAPSIGQGMQLRAPLGTFPHSHEKWALGWGVVSLLQQKGTEPSFACITSLFHWLKPISPSSVVFLSVNQAGGNCCATQVGWEKSRLPSPVLSVVVKRIGALTHSLPLYLYRTGQMYEQTPLAALIISRLAMG